MNDEETKAEIIDGLAFGILTAVAFAEGPDGPVSEEHLHPDCWPVAEALAADWLSHATVGSVTRFIENQPVTMSHPEWKGLTEIGIDIYFTLAGHGVGFWEADRWPVGVGEWMEAAVDAMTITYIYAWVDDDGLIHLETN